MENHNNNLGIFYEGEKSFIDFVFGLEELLYDEEFYTLKSKEDKVINPKILGFLLKIINGCKTLEEFVDWIKTINISKDPKILHIIIIINNKRYNKNKLNSQNTLSLIFDHDKFLSKIKVNIKSENYIHYSVFPVKKPENKIFGEYNVTGRAYSFTKKIDGKFEIREFYTALFSENLLISKQVNVTKNGIHYLFDDSMFYDILV